ncbi:MAG TPA: helix-turn-helix domain-containing protein [Haliangiales bacterium]|nr:helix-turn-helix domain-containing protein [Haliangiales bacterium]
MAVVRNVGAEMLDREVMTADEVAAFLGVDRKTVYEAAWRGEMPHRRIGRRLLFSRAALVDWLRCKGSSEGT